MSKVSKFNITLVFVACLLCALFCVNAFADGAETEVEYTETPVYIDGLLSFSTQPSNVYPSLVGALRVILSVSFVYE